MYAWYFIVVLIHISLMTFEFEHFSHVYWLFVYHLLKRSVKIFCPLFNWVVCLFIVGFKGSLYILDTMPLPDVTYEYFLPFHFVFSLS